MRAALEKIARNAHLSPHQGPGSGANLQFLISKMRGTVEKLTLWKDDTDTSDEEDP